MDRASKHPTSAHPAWAAVGLLVLCLAACHDAPRNNPMDPELTPGVSLVSVTTDSLNGTATITWSPYRGDQPFGSYRIDRRLSGQADSETRATITDAGATSFTDTGVESDRTYVYTVSVVNTAGLVVASDNTAEAAFASSTPRILSAIFDSRTASATISWTRAASGFVRYEIQRETEGDTRPVIIHRSKEIDNTAFTDTGLEGNTEYKYRVVTRSTTGRELESDPASGKFHALLREWEWSASGEVKLQETAIGPEGFYVSITTGFDPFTPAPALSEPDQIHRFNGQGEHLNQFPADPDPPFFYTGDLAADRNGVYSLLKQPVSAFGGPGGIPSYVDALNPEGKRRFRWPANEDKFNLAAMAVSSDGVLWLAQSDVDSLTGENMATFYLLDTATGELIESFGIRQISISPIFPGNMLIGNEIGVVNTSIGDPILAVFDISTRELIPINFAGQISPLSIVDVALGSDNRLYILYPDAPRVEVLQNWKFLTRWKLPSFVQARIGLDSQGNIHIHSFESLERKVRTQVFEP